MILKCLEIFTARIVDVSLGTLRTVFFVKGKTLEPFMIAFFEVLIWYAVAKEAINTSGNTALIAISYAAGYATGTFIGSKLSQKIVRGTVGVQVILNVSGKKLINELRKENYGISVIPLKDSLDGEEKEMLYIQVKNTELKNLTNIINKYDNKAFIVVNETKVIHNGFIK